MRGEADGGGGRGRGRVVQVPLKPGRSLRDFRHCSRVGAPSNTTKRGMQRAESEVKSGAASSSKVVLLHLTPKWPRLYE